MVGGGSYASIVSLFSAEYLTEADWSSISPQFQENRAPQLGWALAGRFSLLSDIFSSYS